MHQKSNVVLAAIKVLFFELKIPILNSHIEVAFFLDYLLNNFYLVSYHLVISVNLKAEIVLLVTVYNAYLNLPVNVSLLTTLSIAAQNSG